MIPAPICPYCQAASVLVDSAEVYHGTSYGPIYLCRPCWAWVGCHKGTVMPLGVLANARLRMLKKKAHTFFDPFWEKILAEHRGRFPRGAKSAARSAVYKRLAHALDIPITQCHIGMFDETMCRRTIEICRQWAASTGEANEETTQRANLLRQGPGQPDQQATDSHWPEKLRYR